MTVEEEYHLIQEGVGLFDFSLEGKILVSGKDRGDFLNGLVSNDVKNLPVNTGMLAAFLDKFGKIISDCRIFKFEKHLLLVLPFLPRKKILEKLQQDAALVDARVEDLTPQYALLSVQGKKVDIFLEELSGKTIPLWSCLQQVLADVDVAILRLPRSSVPSVDLLIPTLAYKNILAWLLEKGKKYQLQKMNYKTYDLLRLEAGIPLFGLDFDETTIVPEIGEEAISYTKGCYVGQEVVARIKNVGKGMTAKKLVKLEMVSRNLVEKGTKLFAAGQEIGWVTSSAYSPGLQKVFGLGFVKRGFYDQVREVEVGEKRLKAMVVS